MVCKVVANNAPAKKMARMEGIEGLYLNAQNIKKKVDHNIKS